MPVTLEKRRLEKKLMPGYLYSGVGMWGWLFQRISGILLVFYLALHLWVLHFAGQGGLRFDDVVKRFESPVFLWLDLGLLGLVLYHGFNGIRVVLLDLGIGVRMHKMLFWIFVLWGIVLFFIGASILFNFK